jgi:hypothetical protein
MKFNLGFLGLYNMIIISLEIEYFEYYYLFPLLKEILNYQGYTLKLKYLKILTQQALINIFQLTKWVFFLHKNYNKINFNNFFFCKDLKKKNQKYKIYFQLEKKISIEKDSNNKYYLLNKYNFSLYKEKISYKKKKYNQYIYNNKTKELSEISLFFSKYFQKKLENKIRFKKKKTIYFFNEIKQLQKKSFFYFFFKLILSYKKWKADELYIKMAHIAYCENLIDFSITLFKMARFEKQTLFFIISILKM